MAVPVTITDLRHDLSMRIQRMFNAREVRVLEAGCGSLTHLDLPQEWSVTGLDVSWEQLQRNLRLDQRIHADLQTVKLRPTYDLGICWNVLEHLHDPTAALQNIVNALKPGGVLVVAVPHLGSLKGRLTQFTPHWLHVAFYRWVLRRPGAGQPGRQPFPTYMREDIVPARLTGFLRAIGTREICRYYYSTDYYHHMLMERGALSWAFRKAAALVRAASCGSVPWKYSDFVGIFGKHGCCWRSTRIQRSDC